ncbi:MAG: hypothetical protein HYZ34_03295 [Ignavibacteriae bacterium]|nr:hypothetical protein [Ignavibacteriota bacterium]
MARTLFTFSLILLAALSRLLPHLPNFTPIAALALFGGVYLDKKHTFIVPLAALFISDYFLGFYNDMIWVYASFAAIGLIGLWLRNHHGVATTIGATLFGSILFFIVTNFGVWISSHGMYPQTFSGLIECYIAAIPFFRNSLLGDFAYVTAMFGLYELAKKFVPSLSIQTH